MNSLSQSIQQSVQDFRAESSAWQEEVLELFGDVDRYLASQPPESEGSANMAVAEDVAGLRGLVEQQTEVLSALVNALTGQPTGENVADACDEPSSDIEGSGIDPFERLQQAVAAAADTTN